MLAKVIFLFISTNGLFCNKKISLAYVDVVSAFKIDNNYYHLYDNFIKHNNFMIDEFVKYGIKLTGIFYFIVSVNKIITALQLTNLNES